jgi:hypothetical protein
MNGTWIKGAKKKPLARGKEGRWIRPRSLFGGLKERGSFGGGAKGKVGFASIQPLNDHFSRHGIASSFCAWGRTSSRQFGPDGIRRALREADLVGYVEVFTCKLFNKIQIRICIWFCVGIKATDAKLYEHSNANMGFGEDGRVSALNIN